MNFTSLVSTSLVALWAICASANEWSTIEQNFKTLPMEARRFTGPLFWMHGDEPKEVLEKTLDAVREGGNGMFTTEPRPHKDWLGAGWYRDVKICVDYARKHNMKVIIYDDWWWPSQMMGGRVPPQYGSKVIETRVYTSTNLSTYTQPENLITVVAGKRLPDNTIDSKTLRDLTGAAATLAQTKLDASEQVMVFTWAFKGKLGAQKKMISVDGASPDCVKWFLDTVYQPHYERFKEDFGKTIVGFFYDEPETQGDWGSDVPVLIKERGLDLDKLLVAYKFKLSGDEEDAALYTYRDCFLESWARTMYGGISAWCAERKVFSTGHFMEHDKCMFRFDMSGGFMMQMLRKTTVPGIDLVCCQLYPKDKDSKPGVYQMPKIASSLAHIYNSNPEDLAMCEIFGGYFQKLTYPEMKWLCDHHQVRGVNYLIPHSFNPHAPYDKDYPPYFYNAGFEPRFALYKVWADYSSRLSNLLTGGNHVADVAFLHLGLTLHQGKNLRPEAMTTALQDNQVDCDWLLYDAWEDKAEIIPAAAGKPAMIRLAKETYSILVLPAAEMIRYPSLLKAKQFLDAGGKVVGYGVKPSKSVTLGKSPADITELTTAIFSHPNARFIEGEATVENVRKSVITELGLEPCVQVTASEAAQSLHVLHREKAGRDIFFIANQNVNAHATLFTLRIRAKGVPECWDALRNEITTPSYTRTDENHVVVRLTLYDLESVVLVFNEAKRPLPARIETVSGTTIAFTRVPTPKKNWHPPLDLPAWRLDNTKPTPPKNAKVPIVISPVVDTADRYEGTCQIPALKPNQRVFLLTEGPLPETAWRGWLNGTDIGGVIGEPLRKEVTQWVKQGENKIALEPFAPEKVTLVIVD